MIEQQLAKLEKMTNGELRTAFGRYFSYTVKNRPREFYIENIAYRMQELEYGGLSMETRQMLYAIFAESKSKQPKPKIAPVGTKIIKNYKGKDYVVRVLEQGYEMDGRLFKTLSGLAEFITGMKISGKLFFNIGKWGRGK